MSAGKRRAVLIALAAVAMVSVACSGGAEPSDSADAPAATVESAPTPTPAPTETPFFAQLEVAPDFTLPSANGSPITLSELASEKPVILVFYRAFW